MVQATYFEPMVQATYFEPMVQATNIETMVQATNIETIVQATKIETMVQATYIEPRVAQHKEHVTYLYDSLYFFVSMWHIYWIYIYIYHILVGFKVIHVGNYYVLLSSLAASSIFSFWPWYPFGPSWACFKTRWGKSNPKN